jgi:hypothetical protein
LYFIHPSPEIPEISSPHGNLLRYNGLYEVIIDCTK